MAKKNKSRNKAEDSKALIDAIIEGIREKKGKMIRLFDLTNLTHASADYFIICHGDSQRQSVAIADSVEDFVRKQTGEKPWHTEGQQNAHWILMDYVNVVVHVFYKEARDFYDIENLWADAVISDISESEAVPVKEKSKKTDKPAIKSKTKSSAPKKASAKSPLKRPKAPLKSKKK
jgi:ribosome-associated protein